MNRVILLFVFALLAQSAPAAQFGLERGWSLEQTRKHVTLKSERPYVYSASEVPNGHPAFDDYRLLITPQHGLCKIVAWTPHIFSNSYGHEVINKFDRLFEGLTAKYGNSRKYDFVRYGSIWDEPEDWMMGLVKRDRSLAAFWGDENRSTIPSELASIKLQAHGISADRALIELAYEFNNYSECSTWLKNEENSSL